MSASALSVANILAVEVEPIADDGGPRARWCRQLGTIQRRRDESARHEAAALLERDREGQIAVRRRWPAIVAAMRALVGNYNEGAGLDVLTVVDYADRESHDLILEVVASGGQTLTMELGGAELCVRANEGTAGLPDGGRRWLTSNLTDEDTAAYALQDWLTGL